MPLTEEQLNMWLTLLTLNLMVMASLLLEVMGSNLNITQNTVNTKG